MHDDLTPEHYWAAGFLEGEGCFYFESGYVNIATAQKEREPLERLQRLIGGRIYIDKHRPSPLFMHRLAPQAEVEYWTQVLYPLMSTRRQKQIDAAFARREKYRNGSERLEANAKAAAYTRERYRTDPEFRARKLAHHKAYRERKKLKQGG